MVAVWASRRATLRTGGGGPGGRRRAGGYRYKGGLCEGKTRAISLYEYFVIHITLFKAIFIYITSNAATRDSSALPPLPDGPGGKWCTPRLLWRVSNASKAALSDSAAPAAPAALVGRASSGVGVRGRGAGREERGRGAWGGAEEGSRTRRMARGGTGFAPG